MKKEKWIPYALVSPYLIYFFAFVAFPVGFSIVLTFHDWNIISPMKFIGLANFERLFQDAYFYKSIFNTLKFLVIHIPLQILISLGLAYLLNQNIRLRGFFRASFFVPVVVSGVVVTIMWQQLYGYDMGILNQFLTWIGIGKIGWLIDQDIAMVSIAIMAAWKNVGLYIILFLVGFQTVPLQYYEAADLEGASSWNKFWNITLPMINPTIFMVVVLSTVGGFSLFIEPYVMTSGGPLNSTLSSVLYIYKQGFFYYHMGYSATLGIVFAAIVMVVIVIQKRYVEKAN